MTTSEDLSGRNYINSFTPPFSPSGVGYVMPKLPRIQAVQGLTFHFRVDEDEHRRFLPYPLEPDPDHPGEAIWLYAHHTATPLGEDCSDWHPYRLGAVEGLFGLVCKFNGQTGTYYWYNFVDTDWDYHIMTLYGFPGKLATCMITPTHPEHPYLNGPRPGAKFVATVDRLGSRVVTAKLTIEDRCPPEAFPTDILLNPYGIRYIPNVDVEAGGRPLAYDLIREHGYDRVPGDIWRGTGELRFHEAENEELTPLQPTEMLGAYHSRFTYSTAGVDVLHDFLPNWK